MKSQDRYPACAFTIGFVCLALSSQQVWAQAHVCLTSTGDTFLRKGAPNTNEGASPVLRLQSSGSNRILVKFSRDEISAAMAGRILVSARIELCVFENAENWGRDGDRTVSAHRLLTPWAEGSGIHAEVRRTERADGEAEEDDLPEDLELDGAATWNSPNDVDPTNSRADGPPWNPSDLKEKGGFFEVRGDDPSVAITNDTLPGDRLYWDVTRDVQAFLNGGPFFGWVIKKDNEGQNGKVLFASREFAPWFGDEDGLIDGEACPCTGPMLVLEVTTTGPQDAVLTASADTYLRGGADNTNEGANVGMELASSGSNRALVAFDLSGYTDAELASVKSARVYLTILENGDNWGSSSEILATRGVTAHRMLTPWFEGNGKNEHTNPSARGTGKGATWNRPDDPDISNQSVDGLPAAAQWKGGTEGTHYAPSTAAPVLHFNGQSGEVSWDVTQDVKNGGRNGWMLKRTDGNGRVRYFSREGGVGSQKPRLVLDFDP